MYENFTKALIIISLLALNEKRSFKHLKHFIKSMRGHMHVHIWNINTKYIYMYKLWQRQIDAYKVLSRNVNSQKNIKYELPMRYLSKIDESNHYDPGT